MYETNFARRKSLVSRAVAAITVALAAGAPALSQVQTYQPTSVLRKISGLSEKLELVTNSSRILTLDKPIPRVLVNNPELLAVTPLSATQVQISAKKAGVTQVNLWDEEGNIHTVDVLIYGDARELEVALQTQFPHSSIKVYRYSESLVLTGFVDNPTHVSQIKLLAEDYAPKVITNINVGGVQQVLLKIRIMEVSRTKLQRCAADLAYLSSNGGFFGTSVSGLISNISVNSSGAQTVTDSGGQTAKFGVINGNEALFGILDILEQHQIAKILAEPNLTAVSGRPAQFNVGGEIPSVIPQSLGTSSIEFKKFGTQVDFLPIVLGNGNIRLEVRPRISEIDDTRSVVLQDFVIPALTVREVDTAVEMKAGQTFALAGLVQERTENVNRGLPYVKDLPGIGVPFRKTESEVNEIELLILVTPEFVDPLDPHEAPCTGPGYTTTSPERCDLYCAGHIEVPAYANPIRGPLACGECGGPCGSCNCGASNGHAAAHGQVIIQGGAGYDNGAYAPTMSPGMIQNQPQANGPVRSSPNGVRPMNAQPMPANVPVDLPLPGPESPIGSSANNRRPVAQMASRPTVAAPNGGAQPQMVSRPNAPARQPVYLRNAPYPNNPQPAATVPASATGGSGLIGPIGYDAQ
jgi:pilus assembly protein CpaC